MRYRHPALREIAIGGVGEHSRPQIFFTSCTQRASQVTEQQDGSARQTRPEQKFPCWQVRLSAPPVAHMSCAQVSGARAGGARLVSVTSRSSTMMRTLPSVSAENR